MKKILFVMLAGVFSFNAYAGIYTNNNFRPYLGIDAGLNIADYTMDTELDENYYSATINAGARIGKNFGVELFFSHSSTNELEYVHMFSAINHELYYMAFGFDIYGYYGVADNFDFFTSFGVANYKIYNKYEYIDNLDEFQQEMSDNTVSTRFGIGLMYTFPYDRVAAIIQYQYTPLGNDLINTMSEFSVGARYVF
ncbi:MAG: outer membrane beta-barrel protein [Alphaproteobacteria bacterium]|nr:outer membrane beta-barrel protein [Alphaproteobacteria bacterium]